MAAVHVDLRRLAASVLFGVLVACGAGAGPAIGADGGVRADGGPAPDAGPGLDGGGFDDLDAVIDTKMQTALVPGLAAAIVKDGRRVWSKGYGLADIAMNRAVTTDTLFILASISKAVLAVAIMQLVEQGHFGLDDDINGKLPFPIRNPRFPDTPITYRMLMSHASSVADGESIDAFELTIGTDAPLSLADFVRGYFLPGGAYYDSDNWSTRAPASAVEYSNAGAALLGYLVEVVSGRSLQAYCQQNIFLPLGMEETSWFLSGLDTTHIALPYEYAGGQYTTEGHYTFPDYPDGQLRSSVDQLARILGMFMNGGELDGTRVLQRATIDEMRRIQYPALDGDQGLLWYYERDTANRRLLGHSGAYIGTSCDLYYLPSAKAGYIILTNGGTYYDYDDGPELDALSAMGKLLMDKALTLQ